MKQISPLNESAGTFGKYVGVQEQNNVLRILKFGIPNVPFKQIPTKKGWILSFFCRTNLKKDEILASKGSHLREVFWSFAV
jgi:hypothetical protein